MSDGNGFRDDDIEVDLRERRTNPAWARTYERFFLAATPKFFEWIGWVFVLGALQYSREASGSSILAIVEGIATVLLYMYFFSFFVRIKVVGWPFVARDGWVTFIVSGIISLSAALGFYYGAREVARQIAAFEASSSETTTPTE